MAIPYFIFLILYGIALIGWFIFFALNLYHLRRFGFFDFSAQLQTGLVLGVFVLALAFALIFLGDIDWTESLELVPNFSTDMLNRQL